MKEEKKPGIAGLVGKTPLMRLEPYSLETGAEIFVKLESRNPGGSVKDRIALAMLEDAERRGLLNDNPTIIEPTSGNTGIALAMLCASRGWRLVLVMPESMSVERRALLKHYGAELVLSPAKLGMKGAIATANQLIEKNPGGFMPDQFNNPANPQAHRENTAIELLADSQGEIDIFVAGVGTGGTISGVGGVLKEKNPTVKIVAVEPLDSPVISGGQPGPHAIQGIGAGFIPPLLNRSLLDEIIKVSNQDAIQQAKMTAKEAGVLCGISSGANIFAAISLAKRKENKGKKIVTIVCDTGERYLSTALFC